VKQTNHKKIHNSDRQKDKKKEEKD